MYLTTQQVLSACYVRAEGENDGGVSQRACGSAKALSPKAQVRTVMRIRDAAGDDLTMYLSSSVLTLDYEVLGPH